jgi:protocatechuate 3,4-dioxygenase beta subunit
MAKIRLLLIVKVLTISALLVACSLPAVSSGQPGRPGATTGNMPPGTVGITPTQPEGPYYPVDKPGDSDNNLVDFAGAAGTPDGEVLSLAGVVYDANGQPVEGALIEIWQTDSRGIYMHPDDPDTEKRDPNFQYYGEAKTGKDGVYSFRTILPGVYEPRPPHLHVKVKQDGKELLTTQFYFSSDSSLTGAQANLVIELAPTEDDLGKPIWVGERDIFLNIER